MKQKFIVRIIVVAMTLALIVSFCSFTVDAANANATLNKVSTSTTSKVGTRHSYTKNLQEVINKLDSMPKDVVLQMKKSQAKANFAMAAGKGALELIKDPKNADYAEIGMNVLKAGLNL